MKRITANPYLDGMMGLVVGDALGVPVEFVSGEELSKRPVRGMTGHGTYNVPKGSWSDDSSMALATLDVLREGINLDKLWLILSHGNNVESSRHLVSRLMRGLPAIWQSRITGSQMM